MKTMKAALLAGVFTAPAMLAGLAAAPADAQELRVFVGGQQRPDVMRPLLRHVSGAEPRRDRGTGGRWRHVRAAAAIP